MYIKQNDEVVCSAHVSNGNSGSDLLGYDTATCTVIVELIPGDSVRVTGNTDDPARIAAERSGFIGHLIQPYCWIYGLTQYTPDFTVFM